MTFPLCLPLWHHSQRTEKCILSLLLAVSRLSLLFGVGRGRCLHVNKGQCGDGSIMASMLTNT